MQQVTARYVLSHYPIHTRPTTLTDHCVLYPFAAGRIRGGLSWRHHCRQYSVESRRVGSFGVFLAFRRRTEPSASCVPFTSFLPTTEPSAAKWYSRVFKFSLGLMMLDFFLNVVWLPIGASKTYGLRTTQEAFWDTCMCFPRFSLLSSDSQPDNGTGAPPAWNWILSL